MKYLFAIVGFFFSAALLQAQDEPNYRIINYFQFENANYVWYESEGDTLAKATHAPIEISAVSTNRAKKKAHDKIEKKVVKVYPYAHVAGEVMRMYGEVAAQTTDEKTKQKLLDQAEEELKAQFEKDLRSLTVSEGVILIKLIDRQTGDTGYELVEELKGDFSAFMWQGVARLFGHNLKDTYEPYGKDVWIENTVLRIEDGSIPVQLRPVDPFHLKGLSAQQTY